MNINTYSLTNKESIAVKTMFPHWEDYIGKNLNEVGFKVLYKDNLYEILQSVPTVLEGQTPNIVPANYGLVSEHEGTKFHTCIGWLFERTSITPRTEYFISDFKTHRAGTTLI